MMSRERAFLAVGVLSLASVVVVPTASAGVPTCTYNSTTHTVTVQPDVSNTQIAIERLGDDITASTIDCGAATRFNTDKIKVIDLSGHNLSAFILLLNGPFRPGFTNEPGSSDEIEFVFELGNGTNSFIVKGTLGEDHFVAGRNSTGARLNLNAGEATGIDRDVTVTGTLFSQSMEGFAGKDTFSAAGGFGTGGASTDRVYMNGGEQGDSLVGGQGADSADGLGGRDLISMGPGKDDIEGDSGNDDLKGGGGDDNIEGDDGDDSLNGGRGTDYCNGGPGTDSILNCEEP